MGKLCRLQRPSPRRRTPPALRLLRVIFRPPSCHRATSSWTSTWTTCGRRPDTGSAGRVETQEAGPEAKQPAPAVEEAAPASEVPQAACDAWRSSSGTRRVRPSILARAQAASISATRAAAEPTSASTSGTCCSSTSTMTSRICLRHVRPWRRLPPASVSPGMEVWANGPPNHRDDREDLGCR